MGGSTNVADQRRKSDLDKPSYVSLSSFCARCPLGVTENAGARGATSVDPVVEFQKELTELEPELAKAPVSDRQWEKKSVFLSVPQWVV